MKNVIEPINNVDKKIDKKIYYIENAVEIVVQHSEFMRRF